MKKFEKIDLGLKEAYEELFMNDEERIINRSPRVLDIEISQIDDFEDHPFKVKDDEDMEKLMESIATYGVLTPVIIREKGDRYEMISGHRRKHACERLGMETIPAVIKELTREEAINICKIFFRQSKGRINRRTAARVCCFCRKVWVYCSSALHRQGILSKD